MSIKTIDGLEVTYDAQRDVLRIGDVDYSAGLFSHLGIGPVGSWLRILRREDGVVTVFKANNGGEIDVLCDFEWEKTR